jgi:hypothetical protein
MLILASSGRFAKPLTRLRENAEKCGSDNRQPGGNPVTTGRPPDGPVEAMGDRVDRIGRPDAWRCVTGQARQLGARRIESGRGQFLMRKDRGRLGERVGDRHPGRSRFPHQLDLFRRQAVGFIDYVEYLLLKPDCFFGAGLGGHDGAGVFLPKAAKAG